MVEILVSVNSRLLNMVLEEEVVNGTTMAHNIAKLCEYC